MKHLFLYLSIFLSSLLLACSQPLGIHNFSEQTISFKDDLNIDVYIPLTMSEKPKPTILWIHGGGWASGSRKDIAHLAKFTASMGLTSASTDYRTTLQGVKYPDIYSDVQSALNYLIEHKNELYVDTDNLFIGGDSAGGHLAMMLGFQTPNIKGIIDIYGPTNLTEAYNDDLISLEKFLMLNLFGQTPEENSQIWADASPVNFVNENSPPILILHGVYDTIVPINQSTELRNKYDEYSRKYIYAHQYSTHGWTLFPYSQSNKRTLPLIASFLRQEMSTKDYTN